LAPDGASAVEGMVSRRREEEILIRSSFKTWRADNSGKGW
jgi:hypothetical protein